MTPPQADYRTIPLTRGQVTLVDASDYLFLIQWKWKAQPATYRGRSFYAERTSYVEGKYNSVKMARVILGLKHGDKRHADHINHDTLDNRRSNLRIATHAQNQWNTGVRKCNTSGFKGVDRRGRWWHARIGVNGKRHFLGSFASPESAHAAYCEAAARLHGRFANLG